MLASLIVFAMASKAQEDNQTKGDEKSASEIAKELAHPNTTLGTMNFNFDYINYLRKDGISYLIKYPRIEIISRGEGNRIKSGLFSIREKFLEKEVRED